MLNHNQIYPIGTIVDEFALPVCIQKSSWSGDFYFRIEQVNGSVVEGTAFKNGRVHKRFLGGNYRFELSDYAYLYGPEFPQYDKQGYDANGYDRQGFDRSGYDHEGYYRDGFDRTGYDRDGFDREGYSPNGFNRNGYNRSGYDKEGYNEDGYNCEGYNRQGLDKEGRSLDEKLKEEEIKEHIANLYKKSGYIKGKTVLYARISGEWSTGTFVEFDQRHGHDLIRIESEGKKSFYQYPSPFIQDNMPDVFKAKQEDKRIWAPYVPENVEAYTIAKAYSKYPVSKKPSLDAEEENSYEQGYLVQVEDGLDKLEYEQKVKLWDAAKLETKAQNTLRQAYIDDRESDTGYDPFNSGFREAESYHTQSSVIVEKSEKKLYQIFKARKEPYFARMDCGASNDGIHTVYLGYCNVPDLVVDWRKSSVGNAYYYSEMLRNTQELVLALKRVFTFDEGKMLGFQDEINIYDSVDSDKKPNGGSSVTDSMFLTLLQESRNDETIHDIVRTIQQNQYKIITSDFNRNILVNGCAGSGKTMILYHRLSYMAYNDPVNFIPRNVFAVTPSKLFTSLSGNLIDSLQLNEINNLTYSEAVFEIEKRYKNRFHLLTADFSYDRTKEYYNYRKDLLNADSYNKFHAALSSVCMDYSDFADWLLKKINEQLDEYDVLTIDPAEYYKCLFRKKALSDLIGVKIKEEFDSVSSHIKYQKDYRGYDVETTEKVIDNIAREITGYSWENIEAAKGETGRRKELLLTYESSLREVLNEKTVKINGNEPEGFPASKLVRGKETFLKALLLLKCEKVLESFQRFIVTPQIKTEILPLLCEYAFSTVFPDLEDPLAKSSYMLRAYRDAFGFLSDERHILFIDEFQNYSPFELETLRMPYRNNLLNLFGDYDQCMEEEGIGRNYFKENIKGNEYEIAENYRNAFEITEYINHTLNKHMLPIGIHGSVEEKPVSCCELKKEGRTAIISAGNFENLSDENRNNIKVNFINSKNMTLQYEKFNVMSVKYAKGLEFDKVYVYDEGMTENEKYVAYTRALKKLVILRKEVLEHEELPF